MIQTVRESCVSEVQSETDMEVQMDEIECEVQNSRWNSGGYSLINDQNS